MKLFWNIALVLLFLTGMAVAEDKVEHDRSRLSVFLQPSVSFLSFDQREYFQNAIDTIYHSFREDALTESESLHVAKQDFQKVNFCFPVTAGLQYQFIEDNFISAGIGFIYDNESVVLTDRKGRTHNYSYTIQGVPLFLEYRLGIPKNFMSISGESLFSIALRWYWVLPGTEIYSTWGKLEAKTPVTGAGFGVGLGYLIASWKNFNVYGDIGFSSISIKSNKTFASIVPDGPNEKARWNIGGLLMQIRVNFGVWNKPAPVEDDDPRENDSEAIPEEQPMAGSTDQAPEELPVEKAVEGTDEKSGEVETIQDAQAEQDNQTESITDIPEAEAEQVKEPEAAPEAANAEAK